ncbi:MAG: hypothetical protein ACK559_27080, partial [bacterium]
MTARTSAVLVFRRTPGTRQSKGGGRTAATVAPTAPSQEAVAAAAPTPAPTASNGCTKAAQSKDSRRRDKREDTGARRLGRTLPA